MQKTDLLSWKLNGKERNYNKKIFLEDEEQNLNINWKVEIIEINFVTIN